MVDVGGAIGWAPASFLVPVDEGDMQDEAEENEQLVGEEKGMTYLISMKTRWEFNKSRQGEGFYSQTNLGSFLSPKGNVIRKRSLRHLPYQLHGLLCRHYGLH